MQMIEILCKRRLLIFRGAVTYGFSISHRNRATKIIKIILILAKKLLLANKCS